MILRLAALALLAALGAFPLAVLPGPPVSWVLAPAMLVAGAGVAALSPPLVTAGSALALVAFALALVIVRPEADPIAALGFGVVYVALQGLVHLAGRVRGAAVGRGVVMVQVREGLAILAVGVLVALGLTLAAAALRPTLAATGLPLVVGAGALGGLLAVVGVIALLTAGDRSEGGG
jgi:hypothetical protein